MTILTKPSAGAKQIPKPLNAESVENGAVIEQVLFFLQYNCFFFLSVSTSWQKKQRTCFMASYYRYYKILVQFFFCCFSFCLLFHFETLHLQKKKSIVILLCQQFVFFFVIFFEWHHNWLVNCISDNFSINIPCPAGKSVACALHSIS